ncbi:MAG: DUF59 domain-containing protein [Deferribacteres bacterium]|nr:DUF59 domain-containing protein [Deferribacteres bacterium]
MKKIPAKEEVVEILKSVSDPETNLSVYELNLIKAIDYVEEEEKLIIYIDFRARTPSCPACAPIAWIVQKRITDELSKAFLAYPGIKSVEFRE